MKLEILKFANFYSNSYRFHRIKKNKNNSALSVHQRLNVNRWDPNAVSLIRNGLTVETSTAIERNVTKVIQNVVETIANKTVAAVESQFQQVQPAVTQLQFPIAISKTPQIGENFLKTYMNIVPQVSGSLLNQSNATNEQPKYDMDIQKTISEIQRKPLMYTSPGSFVISSDGKGLDCPSKPHSTGTSMNQRFA